MPAIVDLTLESLSLLMKTSSGSVFAPWLQSWCDLASPCWRTLLSTKVRLRSKRACQPLWGRLWSMGVIPALGIFSSCEAPEGPLRFNGANSVRDWAARFLERRGWDSNPRCPWRHAGFQDQSHKPLDHLSQGVPNKGPQAYFSNVCCVEGSIARWITSCAVNSRTVATGLECDLDSMVWVWKS